MRFSRAKKAWFAGRIQIWAQIMQSLGRSSDIEPTLSRCAKHGWFLRQCWFPEIFVKLQLYTGDGNNHASLRANMNSWFYRGLRHKFGSELVSGSSIYDTNFSSRVFLWGSQDPQASYFQCLRKPRGTRGLRKHLKSEACGSWDPHRNARIEMLAWQINKSAPGVSSEKIDAKPAVK